MWAPACAPALLASPKKLKEPRPSAGIAVLLLLKARTIVRGP